MMRLCSVIPVLCLLPFLFTGLIGLVTFGELPSYGIHPDPSSLGIDWLALPGICLLVISAFLLPVVMITLLVDPDKPVRLTSKTLIYFLPSAFSIACFAVLRFGFPHFFAWIMD